MIVWALERLDFSYGDDVGQCLGRWPGDVAVEDGDGNALSMSEIERFRPACPLFSLSFAFKTSSMPIRLAVLPRSKFDASLVALLISSGKLVALFPLRTAFGGSRFKRVGRFGPFAFIEGAVEVEGVVVSLEASAPPFSRWPRISPILGSIGDSAGVRVSA